MALPTTGALYFSSIATEYLRPQANFYMGQCAYLNSQLPAPATAQFAASNFYSASYGPDQITINRGTAAFGAFFWYGYSYAQFGTTTSRSIFEVANQLLICASLSNGTSYFKASSYTGIYALIINGTDYWASRTWDAANSQYTWNSQWWSTTGNTEVSYWYNT